MKTHRHSYARKLKITPGFVFTLLILAVFLWILADGLSALK